MNRTAMSAFICLAFLLIPVAPAWACGGFFCNNSQPMNQRGENILFSVDGTKVTAHIQIQYGGLADKFSWLLPLPSQPELSVGTDTLFSQLDAMTAPQFKKTLIPSENCQPPGDEDCWSDGGDDATDAADGTDGGDGVEVLDEGDVGPFSYSVLDSESGQKLFDWLNTNGYDQPEQSQELIEHYVNLNMVFVALKLQANKQSGDLQPIVLKFDSPDMACVPLKLTQIAASPDMPVYTWTLAKARAVPVNFFHVVLNAKSYPWMKCATPSEYEWDKSAYGSWGGMECMEAYWKLVTDAVDTANGHGFVTEFAGDAAVMHDKLHKDGQYDYLEQFKRYTSAANFVQKLFQKKFPNTPLLREVIKTFIPKPPAAGLPENCKEDGQFYAVWNMEECLKYMPEGWVFDPVGMVKDLLERIVKPLEEAQALFKTHTYLTRLFTTISPDEMSKDPIFSFNPDLPNVSNVHSVKYEYVCEEGTTDKVKGVNITYPGGGTAYKEGTWKECEGFQSGGTDGADGADAADGSDPSAAVQVLGQSGGPENVDDKDTDAKEAKLDLNTPDPAQSTKAQNADAGKDQANSGLFGAPVAATDGGDGTDGADGVDATAGGDGAADSTDGIDGADSTDGAVAPEPSKKSKGSSSGCTEGGGPAGPLAPLMLVAVLLFLAGRRKENVR